jgi:hypothetical protein
MAMTLKRPMCISVSFAAHGVRMGLPPGAAMR